VTGGSTGGSGPCANEAKKAETLVERQTIDQAENILSAQALWH
jgi:hypothetical protein